MTVAVSTAFAAAVKKSHAIVTKVEILENGVLTALPTGVNFSITSGSVSEDKTATVRRTCQISIIIDAHSTSLIPTSLSSLIAPNTNEIKLYRGIQLSTGAEYVAMGVFGFRAVTVNDDGSAVTMSINGFDRSDRIARETLTNALVIASGTAIETAIQSLLAGRITGLTFIYPTTGVTTPIINYDVGVDPWQAAVTIAENSGYELFFDNTGRLILQPEPDPSTAAVNWTFTSDQTSVLTSTQRTLGFPAYNKVIEIAENSTLAAPLTATAQDDNPLSPTWVGYGTFPLKEINQLATTQAQVQSAADARLRKILGATENVSFGSIPNPAINASDVISITQSRVGISSATLYVVDKVTTPMTAQDGQSCTVRERIIPS